MFATAHDLEVRLRRPVNTAAAEALIEEATSLIREAAGQTITVVEEHEVTLQGNFTRRLELPEWPVTNVSYVDVGGVELTEGTDFTWQRRGVLWRPCVGLHWGGPDADVDVLYSHGRALPAWVRGMCLDICARSYSAPDGAVREAIDGYSVTYQAAGGMNLLDVEERKLRRLRKPA
jgi:hypothetical protein